MKYVARTMRHLEFLSNRAVGGDEMMAIPRLKVTAQQSAAADA